MDQSSIAQVGINGGKVNLIPNLKAWVKQYYPGLRTAITEYNWGDEANLNGATAQADVLGIFGRQALDAACRWTVPLNPSPTYLAMQIYRNYDGKRSAFGNTSVYAGVVDPDYLSSFAAVRSSDGALTVMVINKQQGAHPSPSAWRTSPPREWDRHGRSIPRHRRPSPRSGMLRSRITRLLLRCTPRASPCL